MLKIFIYTYIWPLLYNQNFQIKHKLCFLQIQSEMQKHQRKKREQKIQKNWQTCWIKTVKVWCDLRNFISIQPNWNVARKYSCIDNHYSMWFYFSINFFHCGSLESEILQMNFKTCSLGMCRVYIYLPYLHITDLSPLQVWCLIVSDTKLDCFLWNVWCYGLLTDNQFSAQRQIIL